MSSLPVPVEPDAATQMEAFARAVDARDPRFDGVFFVAITTTRIYCRPVCPSRMANNRHRRFFHSAAAAEHAGFRPCLRCRPELAPGRSFFDVVSRLAHSAALRIEAGALNGASVMDLARDLGVSERHLRRALEREIGVSPLDLAQTHRLLLAKQLLVDTGISVTRVAFASGFQSLRRFNTAFREQYRMPPSALRRKLSPRRNGSSPEDNVLRLTLGYRRPFAWKAHVALLQGEAIQGIESVDRDRYSRTIRIGPHTGYFTVRDAEPSHPRTGRIASHLDVEISASLVPALMPLIARLRYVFDLDAEPGKIDAHLEQGGLADLVSMQPGIRVLGSFDGFQTAVRLILRGHDYWGQDPDDLTRYVMETLGEPLGTGITGLTHLPPTAERIAEAGAMRMTALGVPRDRAETLVAVAAEVAAGSIRFEPGDDFAGVKTRLAGIRGISDRLATTIMMRTLAWPDAFPAADIRLQRAAGISNADRLLGRADRWRPWRSYAATHLWLADRTRPRVM